MKTSLVLLAAAMACAACKRRSPPPAPSAPPAAPAKAAPAVQPAPAAGGAGGIIVGDPNLPALNTALKAYVAKHRKPPAHLDELAKEGLVPFVPMAPPGGRYELDAARGVVRFVMPGAK